MTLQQEIQTLARRLLESGEVDTVIGYETGPRGRTRPVFIRRPEDVERLVWNQACTHNLTGYLGELLNPQGLHHQPGTRNGEPPPRAAVVVKACDSRAVNVLLSENRFARDQVHLIGVVCSGILAGAGTAREPELAPHILAPRLQARCRRCEERTPRVYDTLIGEPSAASPAPAEPFEDDLERLNAMTAAGRAEFWLSQFDRCLRCYACRQACPMCSCPTCLYERDDSLWAGMGVGVNEVRLFHLGRAFHLAGRCIGCDECQRACPMDIPISLLNRRLAQEMEARFGYRAGDAPLPSPFVTVLPESGPAPYPGG